MYVEKLKKRNHEKIPVKSYKYFKINTLENLKPYEKQKKTTFVLSYTRRKDKNIILWNTPLPSGR